MKDQLERPLELTSDQMKSLTLLALDHVTSFLETLAKQPATNLENPQEFSRKQIEPAPLSGTAPEVLLQQLFNGDEENSGLIHSGYNTAGPGYLAYIPGGGLFHAAVGDFIANAVNRYVGVWQAAPALTQLEANVVRWFCSIVGYPENSTGFLTSGGSLANLSAVITARSEKLGSDLREGTIYLSDQTHHSLHKSVALAGIPRSNIRELPSDDTFRICLEQLTSSIRRDRQDGFRPFLVIGNAGTTNTGAVDPLGELADICRREDLWFHIDAAYGGFCNLTSRGQERLVGIQKADSVTLDPHKGLFLPYGTGCLLARDREPLQRTFTSSAAYLPQMQQDPDLVDFCEISPELSRDFRGLRVWLVIKMHGLQTFRDCLDEKIDLAEWAILQLKEIEDIEIISEPQLSLLAFRFNPGIEDSKELNRLNRRLLELINEQPEIFLTGTETRGIFFLRICILSFRTHQDRVEIAISAIRRAVCQLKTEA